MYDRMEPRKRQMRRTKKHRAQSVANRVAENEKLMGTPQYKMPMELAAELNCHPATIHSYRSRMGFTKIRSSLHAQLAEFNKEVPIERETTNPVIQDLKDDGVIGPLDRMLTLSRLIRTGTPLVKISAIKALEELSRNTEGRVGPPNPLTSEERQARLARLMLAAGQEDVDAAYNVAFEASQLPEGEPSPPLQPIPGDVRPDVPLSGGEVRHLYEPERGPSSGPLP